MLPPNVSRTVVVRQESLLDGMWSDWYRIGTAFLLTGNGV
jgi:hypothetical protein